MIHLNWNLKLNPAMINYFKRLTKPFIYLLTYKPHFSAISSILHRTLLVVCSFVFVLFPFKGFFAFSFYFSEIVFLIMFSFLFHALYTFEFRLILFACIYFILFFFTPISFFNFSWFALLYPFKSFFKNS